MKLPVLHFESAIAAKYAATSQMRNVCMPALLFFCLSFPHPLHLLPQTAAPAHPPTSPIPQPTSTQPTLVRRYQEGEKIVYRMTGINQSRSQTVEYEARAEGTVKKDPSGIFVEEFAWTDLQWNDEQVRLLPASRAFREPLSLAQGFKLSISDLSRVQTGLIGPITDLLTFYADVKIAMNQKGLVRAGDHVYVKYGAGGSWADGTHVVLGQDAIDFDITLQSIDKATQIATLVVRHVPPAQPQIKLPAAWMAERVANSQNNWVQVEKSSDGKYVAGVGQETFEVEIKIALATGRIVSATMDNPVEVLERDCDDAALAVCGPPVRYRIRRQISLDSEPVAGRDSSR